MISTHHPKLGPSEEGPTGEKEMKNPCDGIVTHGSGYSGFDDTEGTFELRCVGQERSNRAKRGSIGCRPRRAEVGRSHLPGTHLRGGHSKQPCHLCSASAGCHLQHLHLGRPFTSFLGLSGETRSWNRPHLSSVPQSEP